MKITLEATGIIENVDGLPARMWHGTTESGIALTAWIPLIRVAVAADQAHFDRELREVKAERQIASFNIRMVT